MKLEIVAPYNTALSKNRMKGQVRGKTYLTTGYRRARQAIINLLFAQGAVCQMFTNQKTLIEIIVARPNMRADPANFIDGILDAIKAVIPVDDRWYAINLDWFIDKQNPRIIIRITQPVDSQDAAL